MPKKITEKHLIGCIIKCTETNKVGKVIAYDKSRECLVIKTDQGERVYVGNYKVLKGK